MKLKSITIEGMHNVDKVTYTFDSLNYLYGRNGAGKSTALQAIQLALLGYIPSTGKTKESIIRHANSHTLAVTAKLDDAGSDVMIRRIWSGIPSKNTASVEIVPDTYDFKSILAEVELPIFNFSEFLSLSANAQKDWFISFLPKSEGSINWYERLTQAIDGREMLDPSLLEEIIHESEKCTETGVNAVRKMNEYLKSTLSFYKSELTKTQSTVQSLVYYDDCDTSEDASVIREQIEALRAKERSAIGYHKIIENNASRQKDIDSIVAPCQYPQDDPAYIEAQKAYDAASNERGTALAACTDLSAQIDAISGDVARIRSEIEGLQAVVSGGGVCQYTGAVCTSIQKMISDFKITIATKEEEIESLFADKRELQEKFNACHELVKSEEQKMTQAQSVMSNLRNNYARRDMLRNLLSPVPDVPAEDTDIEKIEAEINKLSDMLVKVEANKKYMELTDALTKNKYRIEQNIEFLNIWIKLTNANGMQNELMIEPFEALSENLNKYLSAVFGEKVSAKFILSEKANSFSFGITSGDYYIPFTLLSSGEKCLFTLALMTCIVSSSNTDLKLVLVDDLLDHLDDDNIDKLIKSLYNVEDVQIILAGVKPVRPDHIQIIKKVGV